MTTIGLSLPAAWQIPKMRCWKCGEISIKQSIPKPSMSLFWLKKHANSHDHNSSTGTSNLRSEQIYTLNRSPV
jgi:hypothetical protein